MKFLLSSLIVLLVSAKMYAQHTLTLSVKQSLNHQPLTGATATFVSINKTIVTDSNGMVTFNNIPKGMYTIKVSYVNYEPSSIKVSVPMAGDTAVEILLSEVQEDEEEVVVTATRTSRSIHDIPTRVEIISGEELTEKGNMKPGDIRMLLNESTGIQTQQTSATSYNSSIRIQGLDGRYTQVLRDGFPLYAGFSGGLSLMQVAPLDLKQIEVIKGSSSTLYGGGAIAGLVNLVSKTPTEKRLLNFLVNGTSAGGLDISGFYSQKFRRVGLTIFGSRNTSLPYDPADIGLTAIPKFERYTINPKVFFYGNKTTGDIGFSVVNEHRVGGSINYIKHGTAGYFESNKTTRFSTQASLTHILTAESQITLKNSYSRFNRFIEVPAYSFQGVQQSTFSELTYNHRTEKMQWILGANFITDDFGENKLSTTILRNYHYNTLGVFLQNTWSPIQQFTLETGFRTDYVKQYGFEWLPRISALLKMTPRLTGRLGAGFGYKNPSVFNEEAEKVHFQNILPINQSATNNERSVGSNFDINYRTKIGKLTVSINQLFFYTRLNRPLILTMVNSTHYQFVNDIGHIDTKGFETNVRLVYNNFKLFVGYTYADVNNHVNRNKNWFPLTARNRLNNVLMYEKEGNLKIGAEAYYFSKQKLSDGRLGKEYWTFGLMGEKIWKHLSIFINFENLTDTRQTRFDTIYSGSVTNPSFRDIYAPVDGFVANGGIKLFL